MKKITTLFLGVLFAMTPALLFTHDASALSCLQVNQKVGVIESLSPEQGYGSTNIYNLEDVVNIPWDQKTENMSDIIIAHTEYKQGVLVDSGFSDNTPEIRIQDVHQNLINIGDVVVLGGDHGVVDCAGPSITAVFDATTQELKLAQFSSVPFDSSDLGSGNMIAHAFQNLVNNVVLFTYNNTSFALSDGMTEQLDQQNIEKVSLHRTGRDQEQWPGGGAGTIVSYLGFGVEYTAQNIPQPQGNLCSITYSRLIMFGVRGNDVAQTQQCLNNLGYNTGVVDGIYGRNTYRGIVSFQTSQNIKIDGIVGPQTVSYLNTQ